MIGDRTRIPVRPAPPCPPRLAPPGPAIAQVPSTSRRVTSRGAGVADEAEAGYDVDKLRKRGRPTVGDGPGVVVPVRMDAALLEALNAGAEQEQVSRSEAIRDAVRAWIEVG